MKLINFACLLLTQAHLNLKFCTEGQTKITICSDLNSTVRWQEMSTIGSERFVMFVGFFLLIHLSRAEYY